MRNPRTRARKTHCRLGAGRLCGERLGSSVRNNDIIITPSHVHECAADAAHGLGRISPAPARKTIVGQRFFSLSLSISVSLLSITAPYSRATRLRRSHSSSILLGPESSIARFYRTTGNSKEI